VKFAVDRGQGMGAKKQKKNKNNQKTKKKKKKNPPQQKKKTHKKKTKKTKKKKNPPGALAVIGGNVVMSLSDVTTGALIRRAGYKPCPVGTRSAHRLTGAFSMSVSSPPATEGVACPPPSRRGDRATRCHAHQTRNDAPCFFFFFFGRWRYGPITYRHRPASWPGFWRSSRFTP